MTRVNPEEYREEMQTLYVETNKRKDDEGNVISKSIKFDELSYFKDGRDEFIVGTYRQREDIPRRKISDDDEYVEPYTKAKSTVFGMSLKKGKLVGEPLQIESSSRSEYTKVGMFGYDPCAKVAVRDSVTRSAATSVSITVGNVAHPSFRYVDEGLGYCDVTNLREVSAWVVRGKNQNPHLLSEVDNRKAAAKICSRFIEPRGEALQMFKAEQERRLRVERIGEMREWLKEKQAKIAEKQEKRRIAEEAKRQKAMRDKFTR